MCKSGRESWSHRLKTFHLPLAILRKLMSFSGSWNVGQSSYHTGKVRGQETYEDNKGCLKLFSNIKGSCKYLHDWDYETQNEHKFIVISNCNLFITSIFSKHGAP